MRIRAKTSLLATALALMAFYLCKDFIYPNVIHLQVGMREHDSPTRQPSNKTSYVYSWPRCQPNESAANIRNFSTLPDRMKEFIYYRHCRHFPMLLDLPDKCGGPERSSEVFLLLVIKSSPKNYDRREVLRKTWAEERMYNGVWIRRLFISGTTESGFEEKRLNKLLELEQRDYSDILQWDFRESFYNLTLKQILFLEWMERNCPNARFLLNGDDDVFAHTSNMVEFLQGLEDNNGSKHLFTGSLLEGMPPVRDSWSKYFVPVQIHESDSFPPYCSGGGYLLSGYTAMVIYKMSQSVDLIPIDDAYMGMCMIKAGLRPTAHEGMKPWGLYIPMSTLDKLHPCFFKDVLLVHRFLSGEVYFLWHRVLDPHLKCSSSLKRR